MTKQLTLGTAQITEKNGTLTVRYMNTGSFLVGEQTFGAHRLGWNAAVSFCRERGLKVIECTPEPKAA